jgi:hypothetical protein
MAAASLNAPGSPWKATRKRVDADGGRALVEFGDDESGCNEAGSLGQSSVLTALRHQV